MRFFISQPATAKSGFSILYCPIDIATRENRVERTRRANFVNKMAKIERNPALKYNPLGKTGMLVSNISLGGAAFGKKIKFICFEV